MSENKEIVFSDSEYIHETIDKETRPDEKHWKRVTQLAGVKVAEGKVVSTFCEMIKPIGEYSDTVWAALAKITGLNKDDVLSGRPFPIVYKEFIDFCGEAKVVVMVGNKEVHEMDAKEQRVQLDCSHYIRFKPSLVKSDENFKPFCSGELYQFAGLEANQVLPNLSTHNALFNSASMAAFYFYLLETESNTCSKK